MADRTALVTGATGFIGGRVVSALVADGWQVRATGRRARPDGLPAGAAYVAADLAGDDDLTGLLVGVTHLFHLAGASSSQSSVEQMERDNVEATRHLLAAAAVSDSLERLLYMSSTSVYGEEAQLPSPVPEDVAPQPSRAYGKAKWATEQVLWAAAAEGAPVVVVRPVTVFGPGNFKLLASAILDAAIERFGGETVLAVPATPIEQRLVYIDDLVRACLHLAVSPGSAGEAYNVTFPAYPSSHEVAEMIADPLGMTVGFAGGGYDAGRRAAVHAEMRAAGMRPDILLTAERFRFFGKANRNNRLSVDALLSTGFRFTATDLAGSIASTIAWYQDRRWIL